MKYEMTTEEIYQAVANIEYITQDDFGVEYCEKSSSYIRTMKAKGYYLPSEVLVCVANKLIEKMTTLNGLAHRKRHLIEELIERLALIISERQMAKQHKVLREMIIDIVDRINAEKDYGVAPMVVL